MQLNAEEEARHSKLRHIERFSLLLGMSEQDMQRIAAMTRMTMRRRGELIYLPGDVSDRVYFLKKGRIKLTGMSEDGHEVLLDLIGSGEIFGEVGAIQETPRTTSAQAVEDALLFEMDRQDFEALVLRHREMALRVLKRVAFRLKRVEAQLVSVICKDVPTRVREALVDLMDDGSVSKPRHPVRIGLTQQDVANLVGASRQETARALKELKESGMLQAIADANGTDRDGTPILQRLSEIESLQSLGLVELRNNPLPGGGPPRPRWVI